MLGIFIAPSMFQKLDSCVGVLEQSSESRSSRLPQLQQTCGVPLTLLRLFGL